MALSTDSCDLTNLIVSFIAYEHDVVFFWHIMNILTENKHIVIKNDISHVNVDGFLTSNLEPWNLGPFWPFTVYLSTFKLQGFVAILQHMSVTEAIIITFYGIKENFE